MANADASLGLVGPRRRPDLLVVDRTSDEDDDRGDRRDVGEREEQEQRVPVDAEARCRPLTSPRMELRALDPIGTALAPISRELIIPLRTTSEQTKRSRAVNEEGGSSEEEWKEGGSEHGVDGREDGRGYPAREEEEEEEEGRAPGGGPHRCGARRGQSAAA